MYIYIYIVLTLHVFIWEVPFQPRIQGSGAYNRNEAIRVEGSGSASGSNGAVDWWIYYG
jgi:hypothetical protein